MRVFVVELGEDLAQLARDGDAEQGCVFEDAYALVGYIEIGAQGAEKPFALVEQVVEQDGQHHNQKDAGLLGKPLEADGGGQLLCDNGGKHPRNIVGDHKAKQDDEGCVPLADKVGQGGADHRYNRVKNLLHRSTPNSLRQVALPTAPSTERPVAF